MSNEKNENIIDQIFDENELEKAIRKGKRKSILRNILITIVVAAVVFISIMVINTCLMTKSSKSAFESTDALVRLTVPNGYISSSVDTISLFGGKADYTISRNIGDKPVILERQVYTFGYIPQLFISRSQGNASHIVNQWPTDYWEYGHRKMIFFHPEIFYEEYKNDLIYLEEIESDKLVEVGISFDKPYKVSDLSKLLPDININFFWVDAFTDEDRETFKRRVNEYASKSAFINEFEILGVPGQFDFNDNYNMFLNNLKASEILKYLDIYNELIDKGYTDKLSVPILGAVVYGTKDQLEVLIGSDHIKASSFGVIINKY